jgi:hypothetical protein
MNGIGPTHADYEGPLLVNQRLRTGYAPNSFSILASPRVLLGLVMEKANI